MQSALDAIEIWAKQHEVEVATDMTEVAVVSLDASDAARKANQELQWDRKRIRSEKQAIFLGSPSLLSRTAVRTCSEVLKKDKRGLPASAVKCDAMFRDIDLIIEDTAVM